MAEEDSGICISGLIRILLVSSRPFGETLWYAISTILSETILVPVVSRSKNTIGFLSWSFIIWCLKVKRQKSKDLGKYIKSIWTKV